MPVNKVIEIMSESDESWDDAARKGISKASKTLNNVRSAWVKDQSVKIKGGEITAYRVTLKLAFGLE